MLIATEVLGPVRSNIPLSPDLALGPDLAAPAGATATRWSTSVTTRSPPGRAHPMIDPTLRLEHLARAAADPDTGGACCSTWCSATAPSPTRPPCSPRRSPAVRPAGRWSRSSAPTPTRRASTRQVDALVAAGAEVHLSNAARHPPRHRADRELRDRPPMSSPTHVVTVGADLFADAVAAPGRRRHPGRLAPADAGHRGRPGDRGRRPAAPRRQPRARSPRCSASPPASSTSPPPRRCSASSAGQFLHAGPADRLGRAPPARCAAR